jgi:SAM-dependent methyltransferase
MPSVSIDPQDTEHFYDAVADEFESDFYSEHADPYLRFDAYAFERLLESVIIETQPENVLEIGCGSGHWLAWLRERAIDAVGIDISARMCELARRRGLTALHADAAALPLESSLFDLIISPYCALDHCDRFRNAFAEIDRVARPRASAVLMVDNARRLIARYWHVEHDRVRSLGSDPRTDLRWRHEVDGTEVSVYTKMFSEDEMRHLLPGWDLTAVGVGLLTPLASKAMGNRIPPTGNRALLGLLGPVERSLCTRFAARAALSVYIGERRE